MPAQDEIFRNIRVVAQGLDALRDEHEAIKNKLTGGIDLLTPDERQLIDEKTSIVDKNLENILLGVEEAQVYLLYLFTPCGRSWLRLLLIFKIWRLINKSIRHKYDVFAKKMHGFAMRLFINN